MSAAAKYKEMNPPNSANFTDIIDNVFTKREGLDMEIDVLKLIECEMSVPTAKTSL